MLESQALKVLHVVPGLGEISNGIAVAAKLLSEEQGSDLIEARLFARGEGNLDGYDEVWVHSCWLPMTLKSCWRVLRAGKLLVRMTHANLDPVRLGYHGWKKWLVGPIERFFLRRCAKIVATCETEKEWIERYLGRHCPPVEVTDIKRFFKLGSGGVESGGVGELSAVKNSQLITHDSQLHLLYLGRRHPLKGLEFLEEAIRQISSVPHSPFPVPPQLKVVSNAFGEEKEKVWEWCDVLVLPTLSENFGLVVAEALERGKRVITTDGAPAWGNGNTYGGRLVYLKGYLNGSREERISLLESAITNLREDL